MSASHPILTPPLSFKDNSIQTATSEKQYHVKMSPHTLTHSLQNELSCFSRSKNSPKTNLERRNSLSLEAFSACPANKNQPFSKDDFSFRCKNNVNYFDRENKSESDISDVVVPYLPPCTTLQKPDTTSTLIPHDNYSDCSTSV